MQTFLTFTRFIFIMAHSENTSAIFSCLVTSSWGFLIGVVTNHISNNSDLPTANPLWSTDHLVHKDVTFMEIFDNDLYFIKKKIRKYCFLNERVNCGC